MTPKHPEQPVTTTADRFDHVLEIAPDLTGVDHPYSCQPRQHDCPVGLLLGGTDTARLPFGRYRVGVNDLGDRLLIGERVHGNTTPPAAEQHAHTLGAPCPVGGCRWPLPAVGDHAEMGIRAPRLSHTDAVSLLYAAAIGERAELGRLVRGLLFLHQVLPGTGRPYPSCSFCHGTGQTPAVDDLGPRHCHCRCDLCTCNDPICDGPCESIAVMLDALVLGRTPAATVDAPAALAALQVDGVRRIVAHTTRPAVAIVDPVDDRPGAALVTIGHAAAAAAVEIALRAEGYQCERREVPGPVDAVRLLAIPNH